MRHAGSGFLHKVDWKALGVETSKERTPNEYMVAVTAPLFGILYNTNKVKDDEAPKTFDELADAKWSGRVGTWSRASGFVILAADFGEDKTTALGQKLSALKPKLFRST